MPTIYVIAGPNGIGKTTSSYDIVPHNTPIINSDEIAKEARAAGVTVNTQEFSNREAIKLINDQTEKLNSFAIETNLCDSDTWNFITGMQKSGYQLHVLYVSTDNLGILNTRIEERVRQGDHYVRPDIVKERYLAGLDMLKQNYKKPDILQLFDNSEKMTLMVDFRLGKAKFISENLPNWIVEHIMPSLIPQEEIKKVLDLDTKDEVRKAYQKLMAKTPKKEIHNLKTKAIRQRPKL